MYLRGFIVCLVFVLVGFPPEFVLQVVVVMTYIQ